MQTLHDRLPERRPHARAVDRSRLERADSTTSRGQGTRRFLVVPIGFVCDHTEILFDIDVQAARWPRECATSLRRTESLNTSPTFMPCSNRGARS